MEFYITIETDNHIQNIHVKPALYMEFPVWEISLNDRTYIIRKTENGWEQSSEDGLKKELLQKIGEAIDCSNVKDVG